MTLIAISVQVPKILHFQCSQKVHVLLWETPPNGAYFDLCSKAHNSVMPKNTIQTLKCRLKGLDSPYQLQTGGAGQWLGIKTENNTWIGRQVRHHERDVPERQCRVTNSVIFHYDCAYNFVLMLLRL